MSGFHPRSTTLSDLGARLPHGLHEEAAHLPPQTFSDVYSPSGPLQLDTWSARSAPHDLVQFSATLDLAGDTHELSSQAAGLIGAMTAVLHDIGISLEIARLHQRDSDNEVFIFLLCRADNREYWAYGAGRSGDEAGVNALVAGANRLYSAA